MTTVREALQHPAIEIHRTRPRPTPPTGGEHFREALGQVAVGILDGVEEASNFIPGGGALAAAVRAGQSATSAGASAGTSGTSVDGAGGSSDPSGMLNAQTNQAMELLEMQQQISMEQRQFQTVSNVMKARHDTAKAVIQNVR